MSDKKTLQDIFNDDPFGLLNIKPTTTSSRNDDERLIASFHEINDFYEINNREPRQGEGILEHQLYSRLKSLRDDPIKIERLKINDKFGLLKFEQIKYSTITDILNDDELGLLNDDSEGLFDLKNIKKSDPRAEADFVARRKPCKDFPKYESLFKDVQSDLANSKRRLILFKQENLRAGDFYVLNGILLLLEKVNFVKETQKFKSGERIRKDGRTRIIFENGTESNMLYRSLYKLLLANGKVVTKNVDTVNEGFVKYFADITDEDKESGYIYILKSKSDKKELKEIQNLYKIGFSKIEIEERIKNAILDPTFLMSDVRIVMTYKCYNMNPQKLEQLLHNFFGNSCLNIDVFDKEGKRHTPREWFIAPLDVIEETIKLIITGEIVKYRYEINTEQIVEK